MGIESLYTVNKNLKLEALNFTQKINKQNFGCFWWETSLWDIDFIDITFLNLGSFAKKFEEHFANLRDKQLIGFKQVRKTISQNLL